MTLQLSNELPDLSEAALTSLAAAEFGLRTGLELLTGLEIDPKVVGALTLFAVGSFLHGGGGDLDQGEAHAVRLMLHSMTDELTDPWRR